MSNQHISVGTKLASLGANARILTGVAGFAAAALVTGTAVTVASGGDQGATTGVSAPATIDDDPSTAPTTPTVLVSAPAVTDSPTGPAPAAPADPQPAPDNAPPVTAPPVGVPADEIDEPDVEGTPGEALPGDGDTDWSPADDNPDGGADVPLDPTDNDVHPCDTIVDPQQLFVLPDVTTLDSGAFTGHLTVLNCSPAPLPVEFAAANGMTFDHGDAILPVGESTHTFSIDENSVEVGAFDFKYKLTQVGCCADYANVLGFKQGFNPDYAIDLSLTAGPGQGGCKAGCIKTAWIKGNQLNTSVELNVGTNFDAVIDAFVSTQAPVQNQAGDPSMPGLAPALSTGQPNTALHGTLDNLSEDTHYFLLVRAVDDNGTSTFVGEFTTVEPLTHPDQFGGNDPNPGCSAGCITHAVVGDVSIDSANLTVATSLPATIEAWLSTSPIDRSGQTPTVTDASHHFTTPADWTTWKLAMHDLTDETTYHVLVRATDENGKADHQIGSFTTLKALPTPVRVSVDRINVSNSGDVIGKGEVRFAFAYDGNLVGSISEQKLSDSATLHPTNHNFITTALGKDDRLASFATWGGERDVSLAGFCESPISGVECHGINWTAAFGGQHTMAEILELPKCGTLGFEGAADDDHCEQISGYEGIGDYVHFKVIVRYDVG